MNNLQSIDFSDIEKRVMAHYLNTQKNTKYKFSVSSDKLIDLEEIAKDLTRKNPVAIVHRSDGMHTVVMHESLVNKLDVVSRKFYKEFEQVSEPYWKSPDNFVPTSSRTLEPLLRVIRKLKEAPVTKGIRCDVEVVYPEI